MENSLSPSQPNTALASKATQESPDHEESGWTSYFEDFSNNINEEHNHCSSYGTTSSPSLISDAASCVAWKINDKYYNNRVIACSSTEGSPKNPHQKLSFKKTRTKQVSSHDDSLEDTASSPVNSPKVSDFKQKDMINPGKTYDNMDSSLGKGDPTTDHESQLQANEGNEVDFNGKSNDCTDLRKRGLCLVPLSMPFI